VIAATLHRLLVQHGYGGFFAVPMLGIVGMPIPDETLLAFAVCLVIIAGMIVALCVGAAEAAKVLFYRHVRE